ncbi:hypothetical protein [Actinomadura sp. 3N407]|uniref:hypothetical protein n=1 Tax=Actinomadura sp. 3N407 TaxID=3457423 RepID=UPI003FCDEA02
MPTGAICGGASACPTRAWREFDRWDDLERRYFEVFERLRGEDLLRSALLRRAGRTVHRWPQ